LTTIVIQDYFILTWQNNAALLKNFFVYVNEGLPKYSTVY